MNLKRKTKTATGDYIYIYTLGDFQVHRGKKLISTTTRYTRRFWSLLLYLVINRTRDITIEELLQNVWTEYENLKNPEQALRTSIYRLRQMFDINSAEGNKDVILSSQGHYRWNAARTWLDTEEFEHRCRLGMQLAKERPDRACIFLKEALDLYKGSFLVGFRDVAWIEPHRNYFRRLYVDCALLLIRLLKEKRQFKKIIKVSERAALLEPFEEGLHVSLMEALLEEGKTGLARNQYEYVTQLYYREMGIKPSAEMRSIYRRLTLSRESVERDLNLITNQLQERDSTEGAFQCDADIFRYLYNLEERKMRRNARPAVLVLFTLVHPKYNLSQQKKLARPMHKLNEVLLQNLRQGDIITRWNDVQFLALLRELDQKEGARVISRIEMIFRSKCKEALLERVVLHDTMLPLTSAPASQPSRQSREGTL